MTETSDSELEESVVVAVCGFIGVVVCSLSFNYIVSKQITMPRTNPKRGHKTLPGCWRRVDAMTAVKIIKVLGTSEESWEDAAREAVEQANQTIDDIHGIEVEDWTASVENGQITEYKATVEVAFPVRHE